MWILTEEGVGDFLITSVTWCTCEPCETKTKETLAEETPETGEAKNKITKMEETPKSWNTLGIEEARGTGRCHQKGDQAPDGDWARSRPKDHGLRGYKNQER